MADCSKLAIGHVEDFLKFVKGCVNFRRAIVWDVKKGKKHAELGWEAPNSIKYMYKRVKFACVEGDPKRYKGTVVCSI